MPAIRLRVAQASRGSCCLVIRKRVPSTALQITNALNYFLLNLKDQKYRKGSAQVAWKAQAYVCWGVGGSAATAGQEDNRVLLRAVLPLYSVSISTVNLWGEPYFSQTPSSDT